MRVGVLPLGRQTFDVPFANKNLAAMQHALQQSGHDVIGSETLLMDADSAESALGALQSWQIEHLLLLQVTFTDASMAVKAATTFNGPVSIWAVPEPRLGGRLRLNAFCGLNLASHALGLQDRQFGWLYADPATDVSDNLEALLNGRRTSGRLMASGVTGDGDAIGQEIAGRIRGKRIGRLGEHPVGFDTCAYNSDELAQRTGVEVDAMSLSTLFGKASTVSGDKIRALRTEANNIAAGLDDVDQAQLDNSLKLKIALDEIRQSGDYDAFAIRCWPETFTEYGGAVCGPAAMMGEARVPCACEADVNGAVTQLILQEAADAPVFLSDLVDMDEDDNTGVLWHCGSAPLAMRDPDTPASATIHTNRKMPLLFEYPLKPGRVTFMRISKAFNETKMVISSGEMLKRDMAFTGTSGVVRFDRPVSQMTRAIIDAGLEHHMAFAYGDHRQTLRSIAAALDLPVLEL